MKVEAVPALEPNLHNLVGGGAFIGLLHVLQTQRQRFPVIPGRGGNFGDDTGIIEDVHEILLGFLGGFFGQGEELLSAFSPIFGSKSRAS